jgi:hypothetical protein
MFMDQQGCIAASSSCSFKRLSVGIPITVFATIGSLIPTGCWERDGVNRFIPNTDWAKFNHPFLALWTDRDPHQLPFMEFSWLKFWRILRQFNP